MAWLLTSPTTLAYPLTHSTPHGATHTTTPSTTSYPCALTMVVRPVYLCVLASVAMCIPVGLCVGGCASAIGVADCSPPTTASRVGAVLLIPPSVAGTIA